MNVSLLSPRGQYLSKSQNDLASNPINIVYTLLAVRNVLMKNWKVQVAREFNGSFGGIPALLLNEGAWTNFDVIVLLAESLKDVWEIRGAAAVWENIMKLVPSLSCDINSPGEDNITMSQET